jgi:hypothetical protein
MYHIYVFVVFVGLKSFWVLTMEPYSVFGSLNKLCFPSVAEVSKIVQSLRRAGLSVVRLGMCYRNLNWLIQTTNEGTQTFPITGSFFILYEIKVEIECTVHLCIYELLMLYLLISFNILSTT